MTNRRTPHRLTLSQRRLLEIIRSFGAAGASARLIELRRRRLADRSPRPRR